MKYSIYFILCGKPGGPIKIGYSRNVQKRVAELQVASPFTLTVIATIPVSSKSQAEKIESWFHDRFKRKHIRGEWFKGSIRLKQIESCVEHALLDKDWDEVRAENGGSYNSRGKTRKLNDIEIHNLDRTDYLASRVSWQK